MKVPEGKLSTIEKRHASNPGLEIAERETYT